LICTDSFEDAVERRLEFPLCVLLAPKQETSRPRANPLREICKKVGLEALPALVTKRGRNARLNSRSRQDSLQQARSPQRRSKSSGRRPRAYRVAPKRRLGCSA